MEIKKRNGIIESIDGFRMNVYGRWNIWLKHRKHPEEMTEKELELI